ncbi:MAG: hypothetical protein JKY37_25030, partial [Nannocystaceae bacterium]|nr:hypothetical protein [Nannocystaceae bacterium]
MANAHGIPTDSSPDSAPSEANLATELKTLEPLVAAAFEDRAQLSEPEQRQAIRRTIALLDDGKIRVASPPEEDGGEWTVHAWIKQAILLYFGVQEMRTEHVGPFEYHDKIPLKRDFAEAGVRVVPPATARYGSFLEAGCILMPSYINIGAWVGAGTMVDTWATVGSCALIGR